MVILPSKVCDAVVLIRLKVSKSCQHVFLKTEQSFAGKNYEVIVKKSVIKGLQKQQSLASVRRRQQNKNHMASVRVAESSEQILHECMTETIKQA